VKRDFGPFSDEVAYGIVSHMVGVDVSKIVNNPEIFKLIRDQLDRISILQTKKQVKRPETVVRPLSINIANNINLTDPVLSKEVINDAKRMTEAYALLYVLENSIREVINKVLSKNLGNNWWDDPSNSKLQKIAQDRIDTEDKNAWHGRRGFHPIYYVDLAELKSLITKYWAYFKDIFPNQEWIKTRIDEITLLGFKYQVQP
jgi:hypothetical protein